MAITTGKPTCSAVRSVALLTGCALLVLSQLYAAIALVPIVAREYGVSAQAGAWVGTSFALAYALGLLIFAPSSDRLGRKRVVVWGLAALSVATAAVAIAPSFRALVALRAVQGLSAATFTPAALAYLSENLAPYHRSVGIAVISTGSLAAGVAGQIYIDALVPVVGLSGVFLGGGALILGGAVLVARFLPTGATFSRAPSHGPYAQTGVLLRKRALRFAYCVGPTVLFCFVAMYTAFGPHLEAKGVDTGGLLAARLAGLLGIAVSPLSGVAANRFGSRAVAIGGFGMAATALVGEGLAGPPWLVVAGSVVFVAALGISAPPLIEIVAELGGTRRGAALALYSFVVYVGASLGPIAATAAQPLGFAGTCAGLGAVMAVSATLVFVGVRVDRPVPVEP